VGEGGGPEPETVALPSPKSKIHELMLPFVSELLEPSKVTDRGATPEPVLTESAATGGNGGGWSTTIVALLDPVSPTELVSVRVAV
jgi:hypothetical protein